MTTVSISSCFGFLSFLCNAEKNCDGEGYTHLLPLLLDDDSATASVLVVELEELSKNRGMEEVSRSEDSCFIFEDEEDEFDIDTLFPGMKGCDAASASPVVALCF